MRRVLLIALVAAAAAWVAFGLRVRQRRADRAPGPSCEARGAWHVHTTASDGRAPLDEVVRAARDAGLRFVVVTDHGVRVPAAPEYRDGVLVVPGTEISSPLGHVVAVGVPRALTEAERRDPLAAVAALGGRAVVAHPLHPRRPFRGDASDPRIAGVEPVSNDSLWGFAVARRRVGAVAEGVLAWPWDPPQAVLALYERPAGELRRYDELTRRSAVVPVRAGSPPRALPAFLCSADAHGWPSYRAAFEAFSMHVPVVLRGDARADAAAVTAALLDGRATCVFDAVAAGWGARFERVDRPGGAGLVAWFPPGEGELTLFRDGQAVERTPLRALAGGYVPCGAGRCAPGVYRAEVTRGGRPWIFTNPVAIE